MVSLVCKSASSWRNSVFEGASFLGFVRSLGRGAFKSASVLGFEVSLRASAFEGASFPGPRLLGKRDRGSSWKPRPSQRNKKEHE